MALTILTKSGMGGGGIVHVKYLLIGDSFTHGACVNRPNDIASKLRNLSKKKVLNLGYNGNGPLSNYATLREYGAKDNNLKIDKIFWLHFEGNDLIELNNELRIDFLKRYKNDLNFFQKLKVRQNEINKVVYSIIAAEKEKYLKTSKIEKFIKLSQVRYIFFSLYFHFAGKNVKPNYFYNAQLSEFKEIIMLARDFSSKNQSKLYFVYLPDYNRFKIKNYKNNYDEVKLIVKDLNIPFIDVYNEIFMKEKNYLDLFSPIGGHYSIQGYEKVSKLIYEFTKY